MNRFVHRLKAAGACAVLAATLFAAPAQAAPTVTQPVAAQQGAADDYVLDLGRYHIPGDSDSGCDVWPPECWMTHYYYYVELRAPGDMRQEVWDRTARFVRCVVTRAGLALVVSSIATGGTSVPVFVAAFTAASSECGDVTLAEMARAYVSITRDT